MVRAKQDDDWWRRGGLAVYRGYLPAVAEDMGAFESKFPETDFDLEVTKGNPSDSLIGTRGESS